MRLGSMLVAAMLLASTAMALTPPVGIPFLTTYVKSISPSTPWNEASMKLSTVNWLQFHYPGIFSKLTTDDVIFYDVAYNTTGDSYNVLSLSLNDALYTNGFIYVYLERMQSSLNAGGVLGSNTTVANSTLVENASPSVEITFDPFPTQYNGTWTADIKMNLDFSPKIGTNLSIGLNATNVVVEPWPLIINFPDTTVSFRLYSKVPGTYTFQRRILSRTTDDVARYDFNVFTPIWTNSYLANVTITPPDPLIPNYEGQPTNVFTVAIPNSYLYPNPRVVMGIRATPAGLTLSTNSIALSSRGGAYTFFATGPVGTFTISYTIGPPTNIQNQNNNFFYSPTVTHVVTFLPSLNTSSASIPDAFMVNPPATSVYGGAFSATVPFHIQHSPKKGLTVTVDVEDGIANPQVLHFAPGGTTMLLYSLRALSTGTKLVKFTLGGLSAGDYSTAPMRMWRVHGPNPFCIARHDAPTCFSTNGCNWNEMKLKCSNKTLPILQSIVPLLFDGERSKNITIRLPTPVRSRLSITPTASGRLVFYPPTWMMLQGDNEANFTVLPTLGPREDLVQQSYFFLLADENANMYNQQHESIQIRSKIQCTVEYPWSFYVGTRSGNYTITCDTAPEVDVTFTPVSNGGVAFVLLGNKTGNALKIYAGETTAKFYAISNSARSIGNFTVSIVVGGTNAARYAPLAVVPIRVLPLGQLNPPPYFRVTQDVLSPEYHLDISIHPDDVVYVDVQVFNATSNVTTLIPRSIVNVTPSNFSFNETQRKTLRVIGTTPGKYFFNFTISGTIANYFLPPPQAHFEVMPHLDGSAFTPRLQLGFMPTSRCRVNIGRNAEFFKGQDYPDGEETFCDTVRQVEHNQTFDCSRYGTEFDCRLALRNTGNLCVWNISKCILLDELQGNVTDVAYGSGFTLLLTKNMTVFSIGSPLYGQLGHRHNYAAQVPIPENVTSIVAGSSHSLALTDKGHIYAWGNNNQGQLGIGSNTQEVIVPTKMTFPKGENITCVSAGALHSAASSLSGVAYVWGNNNFGQLANQGTYRTIARTPISVGRDKFEGDSVVAIQCGEYHTMVATDLNAYTFGSNTQGQLGRPGFDDLQPAKPILWSSNRFVPRPNYPSYFLGKSKCNN